MFAVRRKAAIAVTTAILATALLGGAALAAFAPAQRATEVVAGLDAAPSAKDGTPDRAGKKMKRILAGLFDQSATYLGTTASDLRTARAGTSLGAIADQTAGKSRAGLVTALTAFANSGIDKAAAEGRLTPDQAATAKSTAPDRIARFVDHAYAAKRPHTVTPKAPRAATAPKLGSFIGGAASAAHDYLGLTVREIATSLRSGKSLGEIADATAGKTRTGLIASVNASTNAKIDKAQQDGRVTAEQATALKAAVRDAVTALVDRKGPARSTGR